MELSKDELSISYKPFEEVDADTGMVIFGFDVAHIRQFSKVANFRYRQVFRFVEAEIIDRCSLVITTCLYKNNERVGRCYFKQVVIDECAASQEVDTLRAIDEATQAVLIGDHKQLGPIFRSNVLEETESLMGRLIYAGYSKFEMLNTQYRSHGFISEFSNKLFYNGKI